MFFISDEGQASTFKVAYIFKFFGSKLLNGWLVVLPSILCLRGIQHFRGLKIDTYDQSF